MRKFKHLVIGGIENKIFNLILITAILLSLAFVGATAYHSRMLAKLTADTSAKQQEEMSDIANQVVDNVLDNSMQRSAALEAQLADAMFQSLKARVQLMGDYAYRLYSDPDSVTPHPYAAPVRELHGVVTAQVMLADGVELTPELDRRIGIAANLSDMLISLYSVNENVDSCYIGLPEGAFLVVNDDSGTKFDESGALKSYDPRLRHWYIQAAEKGGLIFTDMVNDAFTGQMCITCAMPVYVGGELTAVVGADMFLDSMSDSVLSSDENGAFMCVVDQNGHVLFSPKSEGLFRAVESSQAPDLRKSGSAELSAFVNAALSGEAEIRLISTDEGEYYAAGSSIPTVGWSLITLVHSENAALPAQMLSAGHERIQRDAVEVYRGSSQRYNRLTLCVLLTLTALMLAAALVLAKRIVRPLNAITQRISGLSESDIEFKMEDGFRTGDEIQVLAESFAQISHKTVEYIAQVRQVTAEKERIGLELQMANRIQDSMLPSIFPAFPERTEFDIYATMNPAREVGGDFYDFFLTDDDHLCLVMADVSGKGVPGALFMMVSKIIIKNHAMLGLSASDVLARANEIICSNNKMDMFVTVWLGILEISTGRLTACNAGHEYPVFRHRGKAFELMRDKHGFVIGGMSGLKYHSYELTLDPGDKLFLYTDGVPEATNDKNELFGVERMLGALNTCPDAAPQAVLSAVRQAIDGFVGEAEQFDDITMLCLEYKGGERPASGAEH